MPKITTRKNLEHDDRQRDLGAQLKDTQSLAFDAEAGEPGEGARDDELERDVDHGDEVEPRGVAAEAVERALSVCVAGTALVWGGGWLWLWLLALWEGGQRDGGGVRGGGVAGCEGEYCHC